MFRSIFWRLVAGQVVVAVLAAAAAGALSYRLFRSYYLASAEEDLIRIARAVASEAQPMIGDPDRRGETATLARAAGEVVGGRVCIFGPDEGSLLAATSDEGADQLRRAAVQYRLAAGEVTVERVTSDCEPRLSLKVVVPVNSPRGRLGSVMVRAPVTGTEAILRSVRGLSLLTAAGAGLAAFLLSLLVSRTLSSPLRRISAASSRLGEGEFAARVAPIPSGEIGDLALTVNQMAERLAALFEELSREKAALLEAVEKEKRLERMRRDFVANASHQLRTPLTSARGFLEALADGTAGTEQARARCVTVALDQLGRMQELIAKLMDLSRFDAGAAQLEMERVEVKGLVEGAAAALSSRAAEAGVGLDLRVAPDLRSLTADGTRIAEALGNLIDNAVRVSPRGGTVVVTAGGDGDGVRFAVEDRGPGVADVDRERVWERFYSKASPGGQPGGMGLGLAIVKEIVSAHGGQVFSEARPEGGSTFGFRLPL